MVWLTVKVLHPSRSHINPIALHLHRFCSVEEVGSVEITGNVNSVRQENNGSHSYLQEVSPQKAAAGYAVDHLPDLYLNI